MSVERLNGITSRVVVVESDESEAFAFVGGVVFDHFDVGNWAKGRTKTEEIQFCGFIADVVHEHGHLQRSR